MHCVLDMVGCRGLCPCLEHGATDFAETYYINYNKYYKMNLEFPVFKSISSAILEFDKDLELFFITKSMIEYL